MPPCRFFAAGSCRFGTSCKNAHVFAPPTYTVLRTQVARPNHLEQALGSVANEFAISTKTPCQFFALGRCRYGTICNSHDIPAPGKELPHSNHRALPRTVTTPDEMRLAEQIGELQVSGPDPSLWLQPNQDMGSTNSQSGTPCKFFAKGCCRNGESCRYIHQTPSSTGNSLVVKSNQGELVPLFEPESNRHTLDDYSRDIDGVFVNFGVGAEVTSVKLVSDFSSIEIIGLPSNAKKDTVSKILVDLHCPVEDLRVVFRNSAGGELAAEVRVEDPQFARDLLFQWEISPPGRMDFVIIDTSRTFGNATTDTRAQLSTVVCTWYQPSRLAWLVYPNQAIATRAMDIIKTKMLLGRTPDATVSQVDYTNGSVCSCTICLRNLHWQTTLRDIRDKLFGSVTPGNITLGKPTYEYEDEEAANRIQHLLSLYGGILESFKYRSIPGSSKVKATATFREAYMAAKAAKTCNMKIPELGNTKLFVNHIVSVKYNVSISVAIALKEDLDTLSEEFARGGHVQLRIYPQDDPSKSYTTLRLFWENLKDISGAKIRLEKLLAGAVVNKGEEPLWDPYFSTYAALDDLAELGAAYHVHIFRDSQKCQLLLYGGTIGFRNQAQQALIDKVEEMHQGEHILLLTPLLQRLAVRGGMQRLKAKFGDAVKLNVNFNSSTITITGSIEDFKQAQSILTSLDSTPLNAANEAKTCVICWTTAVEPINTSCNHTYCKECFSNQASSATGNAFPLRCFGAEGTCQQVFTFEELKKMLSSSTFESLLRSSFDSHVRTRPNELQYCPTPDCSQVYRPETDVVFHCTTCLTPICTKCKVISHDGITCEEWQDLSSEDGKLFRKYKEEHDVRDCPNCGVGIEKVEGCNHMECRQCGAHICWFCMEVFGSSGDCYGHMRDVHGRWFDDDVRDDHEG